MNLYELYSRISRNYYYEELENFEDDIKNPKDRIKQYFIMAEKEGLNIDYDLLDNYRTEHAMSLSYLGHIIKEKLDLGLTINIANHDFCFTYYWNLLCFYHDLGYSFENNLVYVLKLSIKNNQNRKYKMPFVNEICEDLKLTHSYPINFANAFSSINYSFSKRPRGIFNYSNRNHLNNLENNINILDADYNIKINLINNDVTINKAFFTRSAHIRYYNYRKDCFGVYDHGIIGGYLMYDLLCKNYVKNSFGQNNPFDFHINYKRFSIDQLSLFAYLSDCIASHNIYYINKSDKNIDIYRSYKLSDLIIDEPKININGNPILFLLDLVDSIDPIKFFRQKTNLAIKDILKSLEMNFSNNSIEISLSTDNCIDINYFKEYITKINNLISWLHINCILNDSSVIIEILKNND